MKLKANTRFRTNCAECGTEYWSSKKHDACAECRSRNISVVDERARYIADQVDWTYDQLWNERPLGEVLNVLMDRGLTRREAVVCVEQAQKEIDS